MFLHAGELGVRCIHGAPVRDRGKGFYRQWYVSKFRTVSKKGAGQKKSFDETGNTLGTRSGTLGTYPSQPTLRYRHSSRSPRRSRYRNQPCARRQREARILSVWVHCACGLLRHFSRTSDIDVLCLLSSHGPITSSQGSPS